MERLLSFIIASVVLIATPGPAVIYITTRSLTQGRLAGIISVLGILTGTLFHTAAAAFGIAALLATSALAFSLLKYLGAAYLIYLGVQKFTNKEDKTEKMLQSESEPLKKLYYKGVTVEILNPKVTLFFFAFLPQFINPAYESTTLQILFLGSMFIGIGLIIDGIYALLAGFLGNWLKQNSYFYRIQHYFPGCIYILLGIIVAFSSFGRPD